MMRSPGRMPSLAAGPFGSTDETSAPPIDDLMSAPSRSPSRVASNTNSFAIDRVVNSDNMDLKESYSIDSVPAADRVTCLSAFWNNGERVIIYQFTDGFARGCVKPICNLYISNTSN